MRPLVFLLVITALCIPLAASMDINIAKNYYIPGETFQANITGEFIQPVDVKNIFFRDSQEREIGLAFYLLKISEKEYWVYVDLPSQTGNYTFSVKNALYKEDGVLKGNEKRVDFEIKQTVSYFYKDIKDKINGNFQSLSIENNAFSLIALAYDDNLGSQARNALLSRKNNADKCWPIACTVKDTALALWALKKTSQSTENSWFIDSQNNLDTGLWSLTITSPVDNQCDIYTNSEKKTVNLTAGDTTIDLNLKGKTDIVNIIVNCSASNSKIIHTYLGKINEFLMQKQGDSFVKSLNNKKCFGQSYRSDCDIESTEYAIIAMDALGLDKSNAFNWLKSNAETTKDKAIALYFGDSEMEEWLLNNQHSSGYWAKKSLAESNQEDVEATVFAVWALKKSKENDAADKGKEWLRGNIYGNLSSELLSSAFVFSNSEIESMLSVNPAVIKTKVNSNISITVKNRGIVDLGVSANFLPFNFKKDLSLKAGKEDKIEFTVPSKIGNKDIKENMSGAIEITYTKFLSGKYTIPVVILADKNSTTDFVVEVPKEHFRFLQPEVNLTLLIKENNLIPVTVKNSGPRAVKEISISYSRELNSVINITSLSIGEIDADSEFILNLQFLSQKTGNYNGFIRLSSGEISAVLPVNITFTKNESQVSKNTTIINEKNKTCKDYNGTICEKEQVCPSNTKIIPTPEGRCCLGKCEGKKNLKFLGLVMILLAVFIILIAVLTKLRKPKKEMKDILTDIEKKYDKYSPQKNPV